MEHDEVRKVARLARLSLTDEEIEEFGRQLTQILSYVETLNDCKRTIPTMTFSIFIFLNL